MKSSAGTINIAASAQRRDVDHGIALRYYIRISENILKQADIFRLEKNIIDLYVMLLRFSSLVSETIPCHREYRLYPENNKLLLKKRLLSAVIELEQLKPAVQQKISELNRKHLDQMNGGYQNSSLALTPVKKQSLTYNNVNRVNKAIVQVPFYQNARTQPFIPGRPEEQFRNLSLTAYRPKEETLSRHSIFGPGGLNGHWQAPSVDRRVQYPSNIDLTPVEIPRLLAPPPEDRHSIKEESSRREEEKSSLISDVVVEDVAKVPQVDEEPAMISFDETEETVQTNIIRQPSPPPVLAEVQDLVPAVSPQLADHTHGMENSSCETYIASETPLELHISTQMMESFMKVAKINTDRNLETCGILAGSLKNRKFYITALIIPKQESTSDSCQATNEEDIFEVQDKRSLFPLGWIHTHPTQSCFMSSIDVHTHYSYQIMLPESVAIVMAPRDSTRKHGIFRLTTPGGMSVIRQCQKRGFHPHDSPPDGGPIYKTCTDVYMNPDLKFDVIDLR